MNPSWRKSLKARALGLLTTAVLLTGPAVGEACMAVPGGLPAGSTIVYSQSGFITSELPLRVEFDVRSAGTMFVQLIDLRLPKPFESLTFLLTTGSTILADVDASETVSFELGSPGRLFGFLNGDPSGPQNVGAYLLQIAVTPVPLPAAAWLLLTGLAGLGLVFRKRSGARATGV